MRKISDVEFIEKMWDKYNISLKKYIKKRVYNVQDADDILQNVFYKICYNIDNLKDTEKFQAWMYIIARNSINDFYRSQKYESIFELNDDITVEIEDKSTVNEEIAQCLKSMIISLPEKYKEALVLTEFQNLTQKELSEKVGISVSGSKSRVQRARAKLKNTLLSCCQIEFDHQGNVINYKHNYTKCKFC
jgi:RNA polymerase sigma-70 factor (ECF subfamily)